ncbi:hypothetical protein NECAME_03540 [Necator americanus]|uniref:Uncharacterized protein n=1 Tax=Necator americanus TaxID=51031 RepID=W2T5B9_NECAM|nr:hypothetical protein NECAME_03540 [Necator americanus]ETN76167.1 hypothetical protein NECAME_03540 [Necator americanus]
MGPRSFRHNRGSRSLCRQGRGRTDPEAFSGYRPDGSTQVNYVVLIHLGAAAYPSTLYLLIHFLSVVTSIRSISTTLPHTMPSYHIITTCHLTKTSCHKPHTTFTICSQPTHGDIPSTISSRHKKPSSPPHLPPFLSPPQLYGPPL